MPKVPAKYIKTKVDMREGSMAMTQSALGLWAEWVEPYMRMTSPEAKELMREVAAAMARTGDELFFEMLHGCDANRA